MNITSAKYVNIPKPDGSVVANGVIKATVNDVELFVPLDSSNRHFDAIMEAVEAGELTIQDAD
tara:strand:- start:105 stop:293 length:189 start_codon:yes stop_codon:yes gene_type:complete